MKKRLERERKKEKRRKECRRGREMKALEKEMKNRLDRESEKQRAGI